MLENLGFNYIWNNQIVDKIIYNEIKQRLYDSTDQVLLTTIKRPRNYSLIASLK